MKFTKEELEVIDRFRLSNGNVGTPVSLNAEEVIEILRGLQKTSLLRPKLEALLLTRAEKAAAKGLRLGRPRHIDVTPEQVRAARRRGVTWDGMKSELGIGRMTAIRLAKE